LSPAGILFPRGPAAITRVLPRERDNPARAFPVFPFALKRSKISRCSLIARATSAARAVERNFQSRSSPTGHGDVERRVLKPRGVFCSVFTNLQTPIWGDFSMFANTGGNFWSVVGAVSGRVCGCAGP